MPGDSGPASQSASECILGISFFTGSVAEAVERHGQKGGYIVIPAAPALIKLKYDDNYRRAMQGADLALADSGLLVLLGRLFLGGRLEKISGISYFKQLFHHGGIQAGESTFWVFASEAAKEKAIAWLGEHGLRFEERNCFVALEPTSSSQDYALLVRIEEEKPKHVVIAIAGGSQEKLAFYLRDYLLYRPSIHCIGAALAFLSGEERAIPEWAERSYTGWLARLLGQPRMFFPRVGIALALVWMVIKYRSELPPLKKRWADV
jgi:N-acetylglucosaminyldiphosphoundecaprenol N-acetyl-beta-D-mannosaminyltransferase